MTHYIRTLWCIITLLVGVVTTQAQGLEGIIVEEFHTVTAADAAFVNTQSGSTFTLNAGAKVYRVYVDMAPGYKLLQVYGAPAPQGGGPSPNPLDFSTTTTFWNDDSNGSEVAPQSSTFDIGSLFDSYITVGRTGRSGGTTAPCGANTQQLGVLRSRDTNGDLTTCGNFPGFTGNDGNIPGSVPNLTYNLGSTMDFAALTANGSTFSVVNESWTTLPGSLGDDPTGFNQLLIAQLTTDGVLSFHLNVEISSPTNQVETYVWNMAGAGETVRPELTYPTACIPATIVSTSPTGAICSNVAALNLGVIATGTWPLTYTWTGAGSIATPNRPTTSVTGFSGVYNIAVSNACGNDNENVNVTVTQLPTASFSYAGNPYCSDAGIAQVTFSGTTGGTYTGSGSLALNPTTGEVNLGTSIPGTYTVTYTVPAGGGCAAVSTTASITITPATASISYASPFCSTDGASKSVTRSGATGGTFSSSPAGLTINATTGAITASTSTPGTYTVTLTVPASGGCPIRTATASVTITPGTATIAYSASPYCSNGGTANVTLTGASGGVFSSTAGLVIDPSTGDVNLGTSTAGSYTVTYSKSAGGGCTAISTTAPLTITTAPSAAITYTGTPYCSNSGTASVTLTGTTGGTYSSTAGLSLNATNGEVDLATSTAGMYTVTYSVAASSGCATFSTTASITVSDAPNATIAYAGSPYCSNAGTASVSRAGTAGGAYSSIAGLSINSTTGDIDLAASTPGTYTVTYTVAAANGCASFNTTASVTITAAPAATISYGAAALCNTPGNANVVLTGTTGGTFTSTSGLTINASTGSVDLGASTPGTYTVTYTVAANGGCALFSTTAGLTINSAVTYYQDVDGDGFGSAASSLVACAQPVGYVLNNTDLCPADANKQAPGLCGCGQVDIDANSNGICDSQELTPLVQLGVVENQGNLEFRLKPDANYTGLISATVVTVRWVTTPGVTVGTTATLTNPNWVNSVGFVVNQGLTTSGIYSYRTFASFGTDPLGAADGLVANTESSFFTVPYTNTSGSCVTFEVIDDTHQDSNNLLWFISLAGQNKTNGYITGKASTTGYPAVVCQNVSLPLSAGGSATLTPLMVTGGTPLNCGVINRSISTSAFTCANAGANTVTLTATYANGTTSTCSATVTVLDNLAPVVSTTANSLDATLECSNAAGITTALSLFPTATDNCGTPTRNLVSDVTTAGNCASAYTRVRVWNFTDATGNVSATFTQTINVSDNTAPVVSTFAGALDVTLQCSDAAGLATALAQAPTATDNCGTIAITLVSDVTVGSACEYVRNRTWTFTDQCGNTSAPFTQAITVVQIVRVSAKVFLDGPLVAATSRMNDDLRFLGLIPAAQPYNAAPFNYTGTETVNASVLANNVANPDNNIVDWVLLELRDNANPLLTIARRAALVQRDGDVVDVDGTSAVSFPGIGAGTFRVVVRHRNHLGAMSASGIALTNTTTSVDFTTGLLPTFGTDAQKTVGTAKALWAGNALVDNRLKYTGANNDRDVVLVYIGGVVPTNTIFNVYASQDVNMNGNVRYTGGFNDRDLILVNIGGTSVTSQRFEQLP